MIWVLLAAHIVGIFAASYSGRSSMRTGLLVAAIAPALTTAWATTQLLKPNDTVYEMVWVQGLDLSLRFRVDSLAILMTILVSGIGALVFVYASGYFKPSADGGSHFPASLLLFSFSMLGLVLADSIWTLFIFWELTSVSSFLLVGFKNLDVDVRIAARRALLITGGGGLALLAGFLILADASNTTVLSNLEPISGPNAGIAAALLMFAAATKSAQMPFHIWLPGAMAAPTPVSAYLHSATMVKAGILLLASTSATFEDVAIWKPLGLTLGISTMLWGAFGALRHRDAKLILAWGTISQLGLLVTLLSVGTPKATFAAMSLLTAHAVFKAALFITVGEIDIRTGTRDIYELGGLTKSMPITFAVAAISAASMAGVPLLLGFAAKEAAIEAVLDLKGTELWLVGGAVIGGAVMTVAYSLRFVLGVFGPGPQTSVSPRRSAMTVPAVALGAASIAGYIFLGSVNSIVGPAVVELDEKANVYSLLRWPGFTPGLLTSLSVVIVGFLIGYSVSTRTEGANAPTAIGASFADRSINEVLTFARELIGRIQHGSLPVYLATMMTTASLAATPFVTAIDPDSLRRWDHVLQIPLGFGVVASAVAGAFVTTRLSAALTLGAVGIGVSGLFALHGAPDLALTQLLVETVVVVGFVIGLGRLSRRFPPVGGAWHATRMAVAVLGGIAVMVALIASASDPTGLPPVAALSEGAVEQGGGKNIVNVILTDIRALDTLGEVVVLATVAIGIMALAKSPKPEGRKAAQ